MEFLTIPWLETIVTHVLSADPIAPRLLNPTVPRDLETVCLKCLEKYPAHRDEVSFARQSPGPASLRVIYIPF
ncbi:MAG: hypothetical protein L0Z50_03520 [Verrucomicrobiales bacterium]|nr:hypothetical protein [Verrucomicrobiales bacterium]